MVAAVILTLPSTALAFDGDLETQRGKFTQGFGSRASANAVAVDDQGRAVVVGTTSNTPPSYFALVRYLPTGAVDASFGKGLVGGGIVKTDFGFTVSPSDVAIDSAGRIIVAGGSDGSIFLARYLSNGKLDPSFGTDGVLRRTLPGVTTGSSVAALAIDSSDRLVTVGNHRKTASAFNTVFDVARFLPDGTLDSSFAGDGLLTDAWDTVSDSASSVAIDGSGRIVVAGNSLATPANATYSRFAVARYLADGSPDASFSSDGKVTRGAYSFNASAGAVALDASDRIIVAGSSRNGPVPVQFALGRFLANGAVDTSFDGDGAALVDVGHTSSRSTGAAGVAVDAHGRIVAAGTGYAPGADDVSFVVVRLLPSGALDSGFSGDGKAFTSIQSGADSHASDVALVGGVRPIAVGSADSATNACSDLGCAPLNVYWGIARYQGSPPQPTCPAQATIVGTAKAETINGTAGDDIIFGVGGNDTIYGLGGNDVICGGAENDRLYGGAGADVLHGDDGNDTLNGGAGTDSLVGGPGTDSYQTADLKYP